MHATAIASLDGGRQMSLDVSEQQLVASARAGDQRAFEALYRRHVGRVYAVCLRLSGRPERAEELTQEVFVQAWRKLGQFRGEAAFGSWLHRLCVNLVMSSLRMRLRRPLELVEPERLEALPGRPEPPEPGLDLERAIAELPDGARTVFVLHDVEGYRHDEIAGFLGASVGTSKSQLHRARRLLRRALEP